MQAVSTAARPMCFIRARACRSPCSLSLSWPLDKQRSRQVLTGTPRLHRGLSAAYTELGMLGRVPRSFVAGAVLFAVVFAALVLLAPTAREQGAETRRPVVASPAPAPL